MLPGIDVRFSLRMPPTLDSDKAVEDVKDILTKNVPYGAHVQILLYRPNY